MSRAFPASEAKLSQLREKGIFPRSCFLQRSIRFIIFVLLLFTVLSNKFSKEEIQLFFIAQDPLSSFFLFLRCLARFLLPVILLLSMSVLIGMLQSKFFFSPSLAQANFSRFQLKNPLRVIFSASVFTNLFCLFVLFLIAGLYIRSHLKIPLTSYQNGANYSDYLKQDFLSFKEDSANIAYVLSAMFFVFGLCSLTLNWWFFKKEHMMTRAEVEAEQREQKISAQHREAMRQYGR